MTTSHAARPWFLCWVLITLAAATWPGTLAVADDPEFTAAFRDGSLLRVRLPAGALPWRRITDDGQVLNEPLPLASVVRLHLVKTPATDQVANVRKLVHQLGDRDFHVREEAQTELVRIGGMFRPIVEQARLRSNDYEINWRLDEVLEMLDPGGSAQGANYDLLSAKGNSGEIQGDVADWKVTASMRGVKVPIDRAKLLAIYVEPPDRPTSASSSVVRIERIPKDEDELFPSNVVRIDFERGPRGEALALHTNVSETYIPLGVTFSTSIDKSYVSVESYNVGGRSQGHCVANNEPLYQGVMTIRFCKPGNAAVPAGVRHIGFWTSHVMPDGTLLQAYDISGRRIAEIPTVTEKRDFVALKSTTPIAYIKIVPVVEVDSDFAIDDVVFDPPVLLAEAGDPDRYSVLLKSGERMHAESLSVTPDAVKLGKLSVGVAELSLPREELAVLVPPRKAVEAASDAATYEHCFVRLTDGSVLRAAGGGGLKLVRFPTLALAPEKLVALWGSKTDLVEPTEADWKSMAALMVAAPKQMIELKEWKLGAERIEAAEIASATFGYADSPLFWLQKPAARPATSGALRLTSGEDLVLAGDATPSDGFTLVEWSAEQVIIGSGDARWTIPMAEVASLVLPE